MFSSYSGAMQCYDVYVSCPWGSRCCTVAF